MKKLLVLCVILFAAISSSYANEVYYCDISSVSAEIPIYGTCDYQFSAHLDFVGEYRYGEAVLYDLANNSIIYQYAGNDYVTPGYNSSGTFENIGVYVSCPNGCCSFLFDWWY